MHKSRAIKVTVTRYFDPAEDNHYDELFEHLAIVPRDHQQWLRDNIIKAAEFDKYQVDEGHESILEYFNVNDKTDEPPEYEFEVVEFTSHDDGRNTEEVIHTCRDKRWDHLMIPFDTEDEDALGS